MARARLLKPGFFTNEELCELPPMARLLFAGLWTIADRKGRLDDRPKRIKAELFPYDDADVSALLDALASKGFLVRYQSGNARYIQIANFEKHQSPHQKETASTIPAPDEPEAGTGISGTSPAVPIADPDPVAVPIAETVSARAPVEFHPTTEPVFPDDESEGGFSSLYVRVVERLDGKHPSAAAVAAAAQLERDFGFDACLAAASDTNWKKHPNYLRPILQERRDGTGVQATRHNARRGEGITGAAEDIAAGYAAYIDGKG